MLAHITAPHLTPVAKTLIPDHLTIDFGVFNKQGYFNRRSVAPLNLIGKEMTKGITITPEAGGKWTWESDSHLVFTPANDWPAEQTYDIHFAKDFFTSGTKMASLRASFSTLPFATSINEFKFYQDPVNPTLRQAVATIHFTFPVDPSSLENHVSLQWQALKNDKPDDAKQSIKFTITFDEHKRIAYITSEPLMLPQTGRYLELTLAKGIKAMTGSAATTQETQGKVLIPDASSYFKVTNLASSIVRNQQDRPEQVLTLETSLGVTENEVNKSIHAYLLPQDYPATAYEETKPHYAWQNPGEVTATVLALAKPLALQALPTDRDYATLHSYQYHALSPSYIYVKLDKGMRGFGDFVLANDYAAILPVPAYPQEISLLHKGALLALGTEEKLSVLVRGLAAVKFKMARILPDDVNHLITQTSGDFSNPYFINPSFNQDNISDIFSQIETFDATDPAKEQYTALDLNKYLLATNKSGGSLGLFLLQAQGWDPVKKSLLAVQTNRLILMTDLGLIIKDNADGTHDVFVQSITQGTPVNHASLSILGKNGLPLLTYATDTQGHTHFPVLNDFINEQEPTVYLVRNGTDVSFIPYNRYDRQLNYSRFDVGGITSHAANQAALTAFIFSDRGIYRPGDTAHIGMIVKQPFVMPQAAGLPLEVTITDPRGVTVQDEKIILNDTGYLSLDFLSHATSATGNYFVNLYIVKDNHPSSLIGSTSLQVAEFLPDRMRISAHLSQQPVKGWVSPAGLSAKIDLWNLYGAPAVNHRVGGKILLTPKAVTFKEYPDYIFIDPLLNPKSPPKVFTDTLNETRTDKQGQAELDLKLDRFEKASYQLTVFAEGFEAEGGRSVTTQTSALVSPLAYFVGYKPDGDLSYIKQQAAHHVHVIAVNPQLNQQALADLTIKLYRLHPITTLVKKDNGTYEYQSIMQTTQISSGPFAIANNGEDYALPTEQMGDFLVSVVDKNNTELCQFKYSVIGNSQQPLPKNAELSVKLNKSVFSPGEDIEMQITAPYTGAGLITIERDKVYNTQWFKTNTTSSVQKIHLPADFQGDGYVNIAFVRDLNSPEILMSPLSYSVIPFTVAHKNHDIQVELTTADLARPGDDFSITYKTDKPSKIIVFAVDEGILQVSQYKSPDPLAFFFQKHALEVNTAQIVDQILPKFIAERELSAVGGDAGEALLRKNLNPFKRKTEAPVVYWSGILDADTSARQLIYHIPDYFNGSLRVMAVAVANDAVGAATKSAEVRGYFVINPNVPTFVAPGDEFEVTASIANNIEKSGAKANVSIELHTTSQLDIIGPARQAITIPEKQESSIHFKVRVKPELGSAELNFIASLGDKSSQLSSTLSVRPAMAYATSISSGYAKDAKKSIALNRALYPEYRNVEAAVSPNPLILVVGLQRYLNEYPYGCTEQLVSKAFPLLVMTNQSWFNTDTATITNKIQQTIQLLSQRQMSNGGFNYWPQVVTQGNDFSSVYAMHFLTEAKAQAFRVPTEVYSLGISYLKELASQDAATLDEARMHAYAIYLLTRNEIITTNYLTNLQLTLDKMKNSNWQQDITSAYMAATYQLLKSPAEADKLISYYQPAKQVSDSTDFYNASIANAQYVYLIARHFPERQQKLNLDLVTSLVTAINNEVMSTVLSSYTSLALASYNAVSSPITPSSLSISETLNDNKQSILSSSNGLYQKVNVDLGAQTITFNNPSQQGYFYQLTQAGFDKDLPKEAEKNGIEVYRELHNADDKAVSSIHLGDELIVHIRARAIDNQYHDNVALVDLLPGGFEIVHDSIHLQNMDYIDVREDRVLFFGSVNPESKEIIYRIKASNAGKFTVPPLFAMGMYHPLVKSLGVAESIMVEK